MARHARHKLGLVPDGTLALVSAPEDLTLAIPTGVTIPDKGLVSVVVAFVTKQKDLAAALTKALGRASDDGLLWFAYPKSGQQGTDLNRDILARALSEKGLEAVSLVALDDVWSALRVRHAPDLAAARRARGSGLTAAKKVAPKKAAQTKPVPKKAAPKRRSR